MAGWLDAWIVEEMVSTLTAKPNACLVLAPGLMPERGPVRVRRNGRRWTLHRYLYYRVIGEEPDREVALLAGGCRTLQCQNPFHRIESRKRSMTTKRKRDYRREKKQNGTPHLP